MNRANLTKDQIKEILENNDIQSSFQRVAIFDYISKNRVHPTVDDIYLSLKNNIPTLSKTTVYNTLHLFAKKGLVSILTIDGNELRYDISVENHIHFKCTICNEIYDIPFDRSSINVKDNIEGHNIKHSSIYLYGICKKCKNK